MLCPSNPAKVNEIINTYLAGTPGGSVDMIPDADRKYAGAGQYWDDGTGGLHYQPALGGYATAAEAVVAYFLDKGYNTNYAASWFLVRGGPKLESDTANGVRWNNGLGRILTLSGTTGPLSRPMAEQSYHPASIIPLMFDANVSDERPSPWMLEDCGKYGKAGARTCETFSNGPVKNDSTLWVDWNVKKWDRLPTTPIVTVDTGGQITYSLYADEQPRPGQLAKVGNQAGHLQDYRDMAPAHGGRCHRCHILFADGSTRAFQDITGDGYLNPGFNIDSQAAAADLDGTGYRDNTVELPPTAVFSGVFVERQIRKGKLD
jgi:prepilin-type processing-associated H-X9-DG protein